MRFPHDVPTLSSGDVTLRPHRIEDVDAIVEQCSDPASIEWTTVPLGYDRDMAVEWVTETIPGAWESGDECTFALEATYPDGRRRFAGSLSLRAEGDRRAELAFGAHPAIRGRGVMTAAVNLLLDWGFGDRDLETIIWWANQGNIASRRVAWKAGFTFGGTVRRWLGQRGSYRDAWVASLHRDDEREPTSRWLDTPVIVGDRVRLRPLEPSDVPAIVEACSDDRTQHWLAALPRQYTEEDARAFLVHSADQTASGVGVGWAVVDSRSGEFLGNVGIPRMGRDDGEIGYWAYPAARSRGVMSEAVALVIRHGFVAAEDGGLGLRRLFLKAAAGNSASRRVAVANGFVETGVERRAERLGDGSYDDRVVFDLLASEWRGGRSEPVAGGARP